MGRIMAVSAGMVCAAALNTGAVFAEVSPGQVWDAWMSQYKLYGYDVSVGSEESSAGALRLNEVALTQDIEGSSMVVNIPQITLRDLGNGTVEASFAKEMTAVAKSQIDEQVPMTMDIMMRQADTLMIVSGTPENLAYDITMPEFVIEMDQLVTEGDVSVPAKVWMSLSGGKGTYVVKEDGGQRITSDFDLAGLRMTASGADPETGSTFQMEGRMVDLKAVSDAFLPEGVDYVDMGVALAAGMDASMDMTQGPSSFKMDLSGPDGNVTIDAQSQSGTFGMKMSEETLRYATSGQGITMAARADAMPLPMSAAMDAVVFDVGFPVAPNEEPSAFVGKLSLEGLTIADQLWAMFDPTGQLPRDPATLTVDLSGEGRATMDFFAPEPEMMMDAPMPFEVETLSINKLRLDAVGVELDGSGAMTFDNSMPMPMPVGQIDLRLAGANGLMGKLVNMGLLPQDQVMFAQMMLGLYARPTGDDELSSTIEFKEGGEILANGQRIQ